jgi:hypothetical protein
MIVLVQLEVGVCGTGVVRLRQHVVLAGEESLRQHVVLAGEESLRQHVVLAGEESLNLPPLSEALVSVLVESPLEFCLSPRLCWFLWAAIVVCQLLLLSSVLSVVLLPSHAVLLCWFLWTVFCPLS